MELFDVGHCHLTQGGISSGARVIGISVGEWPLIQRIILSSHLNISAGRGNREEICRLIGRKSRTLLCCNNEIGVVDSLPFKEIAHKFNSDSDSGWEYDENCLVEMIEEMKVSRFRWRFIMS